MDLSKVNKILVVRLSSLGDILLSTPLIRSLKNKYSHVQIDFLLRKEYSDLLVNNPYLSNLFLFNRTDKEKNILLKKELKKNNYDLIIDLQNNLRSDLFLIGFKGEKFKFNKRSFAKFLLVKFKINILKNSPTIPERYAALLTDFKLDDEGLELYTTKIHSPLLSSENKYIGFAPGSRHFTKMWPSKYYIELGKLLNEAGYKIVLLGGISDKKVCAEISLQIPNSINLCSNNDILQTAADMKMCNLIVCNDSGLMHVACAVKIPVVTFFGSSVKEFGFTPYLNKNLILENKMLSCRPCSHIGRASCPLGHFKCMLELTPEYAFKKITLLLNSE